MPMWSYVDFVFRRLVTVSMESVRTEIANVTPCTKKTLEMALRGVTNSMNMAVLWATVKRK